MSEFADSMKSRHHEVNFETNIWGVRKHAPIKPARLYKESLDSANDAQDNLNKMGYVIPAWCDIKITVDKKGNKTVEYSDYEIETQKFGPTENISLFNAWRVWTKKNYSIMCLPLFFDNSNFMAMPGVYDKDMASSELPIDIILNQDVDTLIKLGDPLVQVVPIKREKITASSAALSDDTIFRDNSINSQKKLKFEKVKSWFNATRDYALSAYDTKFKMDSEKH